MLDLSPRRWRTRTRSPGWTSAAARRSSGATRSKIKTEALLRAYGRFVESLGGRYYTACDVGTYVPDMDVVARETRYVTGRSVEHGGAGDSSVLTAWGVFQGMRAAAEHALGHARRCAGRRVGVAGLGKVGKYLTGHLLDDGAAVVATDVNASARWTWVRADAPAGRRWSPTPPRWSPRTSTCTRRARSAARSTTTPCRRCAPRSWPAAANNQLAHPGIEKLLADRGILYAPDYVVNAGGVIQVADEIEGFNFDRAKLRATRIFDTTREILQLADGRGRAAGGGRRPAGRAADGRGRPAAHDPPALSSSDRPTLRPRPATELAGLDGPVSRAPVRSLPVHGDGRTRDARPARGRGAERWPRPCTVRATRDA